MSRGKYRATETTLADGEFAEPNVDEHGNLILSAPVVVTELSGDVVVTDVTLHAETVKVIGTVNLSAASITALANAIAAALA